MWATSAPHLLQLGGGGEDHESFSWVITKHRYFSYSMHTIYKNLLSHFRVYWWLSNRQLSQNKLSWLWRDVTTQPCVWGWRGSSTAVSNLGFICIYGSCRFKAHTHILWWEPLTFILPLQLIPSQTFLGGYIFFSSIYIRYKRFL